MSGGIDRLGTSWRHAGRDVVLIVVSILIAFSLEAWWGGRAERVEEREQLATLRAEFDATRRQVESFDRSIQAAGDATVRLLAWMGPEARAAEPDSIISLLSRSFVVGVFTPQQWALQSVLGRGNESLAAGDSLSLMLARWPRIVEALVLDSEHLERNRDVDLQGAMLRAGVPGLVAVSRYPWLDVPESTFPVDYEGLLRSPEVYSVLSYRAFRIQSLSGYLRGALRTLDSIVQGLDSELAG